jgi:CRP-like cAMP-binding protein
MLSEAAEFLQGSLYGLHQQVCPTCAAKMLGCTREEMVKAIKELILNGLVLAENGICSACQDAVLVTRLRQPRF